MKNIKCPSVARLVSVLGLGEDTAKALRARAKKGYSATRGYHPSHEAAAFMGDLNAIGEYSGVESLYPTRPEIYYLNAGDTYTPTLAFNYCTGNLFITDLATLAID